MVSSIVPLSCISYLLLHVVMISLIYNICNCNAYLSNRNHPLNNLERIIGHSFHEIKSLSLKSSNSLNSRTTFQTETLSIQKVVGDDDDDDPSNNGKPKPIILFLPGLDGSGDYSLQTLQNLTASYEMWRLKINPEDRSSFIKVAMFVLETLESFPTPIILLGESFGGLLASYLALRAGDNKISKLILINPATSYDRTNWPLLGPLIASTGSAFPLIGVATLLSTCIDASQFQRIGNSVLTRINSLDTALNELNSLRSTGQQITSVLPAETLRFRLYDWLSLGNCLMEKRYKDITTSTLILVGMNDRLLPSGNEGKRLKKVLTKAKVELLEYPSTGHALLDGSIDILKVLTESITFAAPVPTVPASTGTVPRTVSPSNDGEASLDVPYPSDRDIQKFNDQFSFLKKSLSPVFLSRGADNYIRRGIASVPTGRAGRPVLLVGNHQLYAADLYFLVNKFMEEKSTLIRGLAHPVIFMGTGGGNTTSSNGAGPFGSIRPTAGVGGEDDLRQLFEKFGAVKVSPSSYYQLLKMNETILLFPGGVKEAYHNKGEDYKLFWPEKIDFIRMAAMFDAIVVPFSAIGMADSVNIVLDGSEILNLPFIGERMQTLNANIPQARPGGNDSFTPPFAVPKMPSRNYFLFQQPFDTRDVNMYNKENCKEVYNNLKKQVEDGIETLIRFREADPYFQPVQRVLYEAMAGEQAPTASVNKPW